MPDLHPVFHRRPPPFVALAAAASFALAANLILAVALADPAIPPDPATGTGQPSRQSLAQAETVPADPATVQAIRGIIADQMAAFRRDDAAAAFQDASPFIQDRFQRPDIFLEMVRSGYAPVYRPRQVEFRDLVQSDGGLDQRVFVRGPDGRAYLAHYLMQRQPDGGWKINGCVLELLDDRTT
ncbi:MAG TPA: DUF4864 domain-containing protein [Dongiaceae bacterium]|nr:DUF4864 domain-containing protein [Dongiaceae bacterium]